MRCFRAFKILVLHVPFYIIVILGRFEKLVRRAFDCLMALHNQGFNTWIGSVKELARRLRFDIEDTNITNFKLIFKNHVRISFIENWTHQINDIRTNLIVRKYTLLKDSLRFEPYLKDWGSYLIHVLDNSIININIWIVIKSWSPCLKPKMNN